MDFVFPHNMQVIFSFAQLLAFHSYFFLPHIISPII